MQRLKKVFRMPRLTSADRTSLAESENLLESLNVVLSRQQLYCAARINALLKQVRSVSIRLESRLSGDDSTSVTVTLPVLAGVNLNTAKEANSTCLMCLTPPEAERETEANVTVTVTPQCPTPPKRWPVFLAGALSAVLVCGMVAFGWPYPHRPDSTIQALTAMLSPIPAPLSPRQLDELRGSEALEKRTPLWLISTATQLNSLATLPVGWNLHYGEQLLTQSEALWPGNPQVEQMREKWQQQLAVNTLPAAALSGWHDGMTQLQQLTDRLNALDRQKGKYITVSELKSKVFAMQQAFGKAVPVEEQLRQIRTSPSRLQQIQLAERHLRAQIYTLAVLRDKSGASEGH